MQMRCKYKKQKDCGQIVVKTPNGKGFHALEALILLVDVRGFEPLTS